MKTPREILLEQHRQKQSRLDEIRKSVLAQEFGAAQNQKASGTAGVLGGSLMTNLWREVIWRCRLAWIGMAAAWVMLVMINHQANSSTTPVVSARTRPAPQAIRIFEEQRQYLVELLQPEVPVAPAPAERPRPQPRSERRAAFQAY